MFIFTTVFLLVIWIRQTLIYMELGCIGGRYGVPYVCEETPALSGYILLSAVLLGLVAYSIRNAIKKRKKLTRAESVGVLISCLLGLIWINVRVARHGSVVGNVTVVPVSEWVHNLIHHGLNIVLIGIAFCTIRSMVLAWSARRKELDFWKQEYAKGPNQQKPGE